jgi:hypothetical protein
MSTSASTFPADLEVGQLVRTRRALGRVTEVSEDGASVTLSTVHGSPWTVTRAELTRPLVSRDRALALLDRLAVRGAHDAVLPSAPAPRAVVARWARVSELPEDQQYPAHQAIRAELDAWFEACAPEDLVDDVRHALAARLVSRTSPERRRAVCALHGEGRSLFEELALAADLPFVEVMYGVAAGHRAPPPRALAGHAYLGSFATKGPLVVSDFCYLNEGSKLLRQSLHGRPGLYHAWISWSPGAPAQPHGLLVAHEGAIDLLALPTRKLGRVHNDAGMIGVFDAEAAKDAGFRGWLSTQAGDGAVVRGITDGRGVVVNTDGDGSWEVRALYRDQSAAVIRVALHDTTTGEEPIVGAAVEIPTDCRPYSPRERFAAGEAVSHPKFGAGRVIGAGSDSFEVAFADGVRKLVHGR